MFGHQNHGSGTGSGSAIRENAGSRSALNQFGSTTLVFPTNSVQHIIELFVFVCDISVVRYFC